MPVTENSANLATTIASIPSGGGADLSEYFKTEITSNTGNSTSLTKTLIKKIPSITIGPNVTSLLYMFQKWQSDLVVPEMDLSNVTDLQGAFYDFGGSILDISNLKNTNNITNMYEMFRGNHITQLTGLDKLNVSNVTSMRNMFYYCYEIKNLDLSTWETTAISDIRNMFANANYLSILDISKATFSRTNQFSNAFNCGTQCKQEWGAYADGIPYVYVKDATEQNWILTANNGHPSTWSTNNVVIKSS